MKIIKYMMQVLVVGSLLTSCVEDADVTAYLTEDQLGNVAQDDPDKTFSAAVAGMYSDMQQYYDTDMQHNYFGQKSFDYLTSLMGNDMIMTGRFGMSLYHYLLDYWQQNYTPTNNRWKEYYRVIANANNILKLIDPSSEDPANLKYRAIALGFRGYAYLQLTCTSIPIIPVQTERNGDVERNMTSRNLRACHLSQKKRKATSHVLL